MQPLLLLLTHFAVGYTAPAPCRWKGLAISDDNILMARRDILKVEVIKAHTIVTKTANYATDTAPHVRGFFTDSMVNGAMADSNGEVIAVSCGNKGPPGVINNLQTPRHLRHRISLMGFRNRLAIFILAFLLLLAVTSSYLGQIYVSKVGTHVEEPIVDASLSDKGIPRRNGFDETQRVES